MVNLVLEKWVERGEIVTLQSIVYIEEGIGLGLLHEGSCREEGKMVRAG